MNAFYQSITLSSFLGFLLTSLLHAEHPFYPERYFIFGTSYVDESYRGQSFVVPITDQDDISHGRLLYHSIEDWGPGFAPLSPPTASRNLIAIAKVTAGSFGRNRDYLHENAPSWNWRVEATFGFNDGQWLSRREFSDPLSLQTNINAVIKRGMTAFGRIDVISDLLLPPLYFPIGELPIQPNKVYQDSYYNKESVVFGAYNDEAFPWHHSNELGWLYTRGFDPFDLWIYSERMQSWLWTSESIYPMVWLEREASWVSIVRPSVSFRSEESAFFWAYLHKDGNWERY